MRFADFSTANVGLGAVMPAIQDSVHEGMAIALRDAGGSLMDVGCFAVIAVRLFLGEPERTYAT